MKEKGYRLHRENKSDKQSWETERNRVIEIERVRLMEDGQFEREKKAKKV